jgi:hypothetical protein
MEVDFTFKPELVLDQQEIAELAAVIGQPGFKVVAKIHRTCVDWFVRQLINTDVKDKDAIIARHMQSQTAAQLYTLVLDSINNTVDEYIHSRPSDKPVDAVQGLDFGEDSNTEEDSVL